MVGTLNSEFIYNSKILCYFPKDVCLLILTYLLTIKYNFSFIIK